MCNQCPEMSCPHTTLCTTHHTPTDVGSKISHLEYGVDWFHLLPRPACSMLYVPQTQCVENHVGHPSPHQLVQTGDRVLDGYRKRLNGRHHISCLMYIKHAMYSMWDIMKPTLVSTCLSILDLHLKSLLVTMFRIWILKNFQFLFIFHFNFPVTFSFLLWRSPKFSSWISLWIHILWI